MIKNVSAALTALARAQASELFMHADVDAFNAPSECHALVARGEERRARQVRRLVHSLTGLPFRIFCRKLKKEHSMTLNTADPKWAEIVSRVYRRNYPF